MKKDQVDGSPPAETKTRDGVRRLTQFGLVAAAAAGLTGGRALTGPLNAQIGISDPCNHRCAMCWDHPPGDRINDLTSPNARFGSQRQRLMSLDMFRSVIDDLHELGTRRVDIVGRGEPFMNRDAPAMIHYAKQKNMELSIISNGSLISKDLAECLVEYGVDVLKVSLNAGRPETYPQIHVTETPENYISVKRNLSYLTEVKKRMGGRSPHLILSFCVGAKNYLEIEDMVKAGIEVGAQEVVFSHTVIHDDSRDLMLDLDQLAVLRDRVRSAARLADNTGLGHNLNVFEEATPPYHPSEQVGPATVPCYAGWYFVLILGNGSVMFCCQCSDSVDRITDDRRFIDIWRSLHYKEFREAARNLPDKNPILSSCQCDQCALRSRNISINNFARPWNKIPHGGDVREYSIKDIAEKWRGIHDQM